MAKSRLMYLGPDDAFEEAQRRIRTTHEAGYPSLNLSKLGLTKVPSEIEMLTELKSLQLDENELTAFPGGITKLKRLAHLDLSQNQIASLPRGIGTFASIESIKLRLNGITALPPGICRLRKLRLLDLGGNRITEVPARIGELTKLTMLDLGGNRLTRVPADVFDLSNLETLDLAWNQIDQLTIGNIRSSSLASLDLSGNKLTHLPTRLGNLVSLRELDLRNNRLADLPDELRKLTSLVTLHLHGNVDLRIPGEVLGAEPRSGESESVASAKAVLEYYFTSQSEGSKPMQEVRLLLVGRGRVGKTTLLRSLRGETIDEQEPETPGICVLPLSVDCQRGKATGHVWDFGGQEFLHGTHQIFLAERCVYLLVLEGREGNWETESDYWLRFIQSFGGESPVVFVLTKFDAHPFSVDRHRLRERCPQIEGFVEFDAFTQRGLANLRTMIANAVNCMQDVWLPLPKSWHQVKEKLTATDKSFLEYREYQSLCQKNGVSDTEKQDGLAQTLHRLGVALNFRDHARLCETSVLKPEWVTEAVYGLIRHVQHMESHGVLPRSWVADALPRDLYPEHKHNFVLDLMERFEVAFQLDPNQWLIPELLSEVQPAAFEEFQGPGIRRVRFSYPEALPPGLLPRLIVRTHELSVDHPEWRWRSGVVLSWGESRALVRLSRSDRRTEVAVKGGSSDDQLRLFDLIRSHLTVLHGKVRIHEEVELEGHRDTWVGVDKMRLLEAAGKWESLEETRDHKLTTVPVGETLDKVESKEARNAGRDTAPKRMRLFVSYAHADARTIKPLSTHLTILGRRGYIQSWQDSMLIAGEEWEDRIMEELNRADIVLLLYSTASRASAFIQDKEAPRAVHRAQQGTNPCTLITVSLDRQDWDITWPLEQELKVYQAATFNNQPVLKFRPQSDGWQEVEKAIREAVEQRRRPRLGSS